MLSRFSSATIPSTSRTGVSCSGAGILESNLLRGGNPGIQFAPGRESGNPICSRAGIRESNLLWDGNPESGNPRVRCHGPRLYVYHLTMRGPEIGTRIPVQLSTLTSIVASIIMHTHAPPSATRGSRGYIRKHVVDRRERARKLYSYV